MATISMILSGLALLAAIISLALTVRNEKRSQKRKTDLVNYVDAKIREAEAKHNEDETHYRICFSQELEKLLERIENLEKGIENLEKGITPDYEQAKVAADAVNNFNQGISNLLGFDPYEALKASRRKDSGGSE